MIILNFATRLEKGSDKEFNFFLSVRTMVEAFGEEDGSWRDCDGGGTTWCRMLLRHVRLIDFLLIGKLVIIFCLWS